MSTRARSGLRPARSARRTADRRVLPDAAALDQWGPSTGPPSPPSSGRTGADAAVGIVFGLLAGSNLVQGAWIAEYPWLNLTTAAFVLALPITLVGLRKRTTVTGALCILLLMLALALGFLAPALTVNAGQKRLSVAIGVAFVFIASYLSLDTPRRVKWFFITLVCLAIPVVVGQIIAADPVALATGRRTPLGLNAIGAGRAIGSALVLVVTMIVVPWSRSRRLPLILIAVVLGISLYLDGSRGPIVGVLAAVILVVFLHPTLRQVHKLAMFAILGVLTALSYRRSVSTNSRLADLTTSGRNELYSQAVQIATDHPLGIGWGNFGKFAPAGLLGADQGDNVYAHNVILEFWIEAGVLGAIAFIVVAILILATSLNRAKTSALTLALAALVVNLLTGAMLSSDVVGNRMMWVVFGAILATAVTTSTPRTQRSPVLRDRTQARRRVRHHL